MGEFLNGTTLFGTGLIVAGFALLASAFFGAGRMARRRQMAWVGNDRSRSRRPPPPIRRTAVAADTVPLRAVPAPPRWVPPR